jgi:sterol desaturase/sphingolipid hydroxylase (fatty acid hydroxylase superfamily)
MHAFAWQTYLHDAPHMWLHSLFIDVRRYVVFAVAVWLTLWVLLKRPLRARKIREATPPWRQLVREFAFSVRSVMVFSTVGVVFIDGLDRAGFYPMSRMAQHWGPAWFVAALVLMIVGQDAWIYWTHRWMHRPRWFRSFHRRHHLSHNPSPFTAYSFDLGEALLMVAFVVIWPMIVPTPWGVVGFFMFHQIFRNTLLHAGYELTPARADGRPWFGWLTTTTHHDLHHAQAGWNYAPWFTWWDRWMGTEHPEYHARYAAIARRPLLVTAGSRPEGMETR